MSSDEGASSAIVGVATGGIQDVSALLPILGTEQCEKLVTSALRKGLLYAAATPMSMFGSLGTVKAGFVALWGTIDLELFPGPKFLTDAGFAPSGMGELLIPVKTDNRDLYVAEDKLQRHCSGIKIQSVNIDLGSKDLWRWNLRLILGTIVLSSLGLSPYVYLIGTSSPEDHFRTTWLYPILRIVGNDLVVVLIQLIFQFRILEEVDFRLRFVAADIHLKERGVSAPSFWDPNKRSKDVLIKSSSSNRDPNWLKNRPSFLEGVGKLTGFTVPDKHTLKSETPSEKHRWSSLADNHSGAEMGDVKPETPSPPPPSLVRVGRGSWKVSSLLWVGRFFLLLGLGLSVFGYIGCFSVVQRNPRNNPQGPLIWLLCEAALSVLRTLIWAWNPGWDDAPSPIVWKKVRPEVKNGNKGEETEVQQDKNLYGLGWTLESLTANNVHALIIGVDNPPGVSTATECARDVDKYVQSTLLVPRGQVTLLLKEGATKKKIVKSLKALSRRVEAESAIIIYISMPSAMMGEGGDEPHFIPFQPVGDPKPGEAQTGSLGSPPTPQSTIPFSRITELLGRSDGKSDNITLIVESPRASIMGENNEFDSQGGNGQGTGLGITGLVGHSSHILVGSVASDRPEGSFTKKLLEVLQSKENSDKLPTMSYKDLIKSINSVPGKAQHRYLWNLWPLGGASSAGPTRRSWRNLWQGDHSTPTTEPHDESLEMIGKNRLSFCTTLYQHRLLFGGLFSRKLGGEPDPVFTITYSDLVPRQRAPTLSTATGPASDTKQDLSDTAQAKAEKTSLGPDYIVAPQPPDTSNVQFPLAS